MNQGFIFDLFGWFGGNVSNENIIISIFSTAVLLFVLFPVHECAHALAAKFLGDDTADRQGRITLNPLPHLDMLGTIFILMFAVGWAKPVPVNPNRCRKVSTRAAMVITALAGPLSNILMSYVFIVITKIIINNAGQSMVMGYVASALLLVALRSLFLAVFNLLPIPPLDGSYVLRYFIPARWEYFLTQYQNVITMVFFMLIFTTRIFGNIIVPLGLGLLNILDVLSGFAGTLPRFI
jgi:Zn-dependent protease